MNHDAAISAIFVISIGYMIGQPMTFTDGVIVFLLFAIRNEITR